MDFQQMDLARFWIPMPSIPDSTSKNFMDSGIRITLHGAIRRWFEDTTMYLNYLSTAESCLKKQDWI